MKIVLPEKCSRIIHTLEENGFEAYAVGGCVRDSCLGRVPNDWDITTSASPQEVMGLFHHTVETGVEHGTVTVLMGKEAYEVTTYRIDGAYEDARHPSGVTFTKELREDLRRRDFTVNAMAYNDRNGLVDLFGGEEDLRRKVIRCVGDPMERFGEDALRIMRAVRFGAQLGFSIDPDTEKAIRAYAPSLQRISAERIHAELEKLLLSDRPQDLRIAWETGITAMVLPEFDRIMKQEQTGPHHDLTAGEHTLLAMQKVPATRVLRFCMLLHDMGKPETASVDADGVWHFKGHAEAGAAKAERILKRLKFDNDSLRRIVRLVRAHSTHVKPEPEAVRRAVHEIGEDIFEEYLLVRRADILAQKPGTQEERLEKLAAAEHIYREILEKGECLSLKTLAVSGADLIADGMRPGKEIGRVLGQLLDDVLTWPEHNEREYLLKKSRSLR